MVDGKDVGGSRAAPYKSHKRAYHAGTKNGPRSPSARLHAG